MLRIKILIPCIFLSWFGCIAQQNNIDSIKTIKKPFLDNSILFGISFAKHAPSGNLKERFGQSNTFGFNTSYKFNRNIYLHCGLDILFSSNVKENGILDSIIGKSGDLIDNQGNLAIIRLYQRGYSWHINAGKIIPLSRLNPNSGLLITGGVGFLQHKIKFQFTRNILPQLEDNYFKGYDRLTNGLMFRGFIGYQRIAENGMFNFFAGIEILKGNTYNRRELNYDTRVKETRLRNDILTGLKFGIQIKIEGNRANTRKGDDGSFFE